MMKSKIKAIAEKQGINRQDLSFKAGITWPTIDAVWVGDLSKTRGDTLRKLALALNCTIEDLYVYKEN